MTPDQLRELREKAEKATPGPWETAETPGFGHDHAPYTVVNGDNEQITECWDNTPGAWKPEQNEGNAAFIAAANPQTVIALLDEIERLREALNDKHSKLQVDANIEREYSNRLRQQLTAMRAARDELAEIAKLAAHNHDKPRNHWDDRIAALRNVGADQ